MTDKQSNIAKHAKRVQASERNDKKLSREKVFKVNVKKGNVQGNKKSNLHKEEETPVIVVDHDNDDDEVGDISADLADMNRSDQTKKVRDKSRLIDFVVHDKGLGSQLTEEQRGLVEEAYKLVSKITLSDTELAVPFKPGIDQKKLCISMSENGYLQEYLSYFPKTDWFKKRLAGLYDILADSVITQKNPRVIFNLVNGHIVMVNGMPYSLYIPRYRASFLREIMNELGLGDVKELSNKQIKRITYHAQFKRKQTIFGAQAGSYKEQPKLELTERFPNATTEGKDVLEHGYGVGAVTKRDLSKGSRYKESLVVPLPEYKGTSEVAPIVVAKPIKATKAVVAISGPLTKEQKAERKLLAKERSAKRLEDSIIAAEKLQKKLDRDRANKIAEREYKFNHPPEALVEARRLREEAQAQRLADLIAKATATSEAVDNSANEGVFGKGPTTNADPGGDGPRNYRLLYDLLLVDQKSHEHQYGSYQNDTLFMRRSIWNDNFYTLGGQYDSYKTIRLDLRVNAVSSVDQFGSAAYCQSHSAFIEQPICEMDVPLMVYTLLTNFLKQYLENITVLVNVTRHPFEDKIVLSLTMTTYTQEHRRLWVKYLQRMLKKEEVLVIHSSSLVEKKLEITDEGCVACTTLNGNNGEETNSDCVKKGRGDGRTGISAKLQDLRSSAKKKSNDFRRISKQDLKTHLSEEEPFDEHLKHHQRRRDFISERNRLNESMQECDKVAHMSYRGDFKGISQNPSCAPLANKEPIFIARPQGSTAMYNFHVVKNVRSVKEGYEWRKQVESMKRKGKVNSAATFYFCECGANCSEQAFCRAWSSSRHEAKHTLHVAACQLPHRCSTSELFILTGQEVAKEQYCTACDEDTFFEILEPDLAAFHLEDLSDKYEMVPMRPGEEEAIRAELEVLKSISKVAKKEPKPIKVEEPVDTDQLAMRHVWEAELERELRKPVTGLDDYGWIEEDGWDNNRFTAALAAIEYEKNPDVIEHLIRIYTMKQKTSGANAPLKHQTYITRYLEKANRRLDFLKKVAASNEKVKSKKVGPTNDDFQVLVDQINGDKKMSPAEVAEYEKKQAADALKARLSKAVMHSNHSLMAEQYAKAKPINLPQSGDTPAPKKEPRGKSDNTNAAVPSQLALGISAFMPPPPGFDAPPMTLSSDVTTLLGGWLDGDGNVNSYPPPPAPSAPPIDSGGASPIPPAPPVMPIPSAPPLDDGGVQPVPAPPPIPLAPPAPPTVDGGVLPVPLVPPVDGNGAPVDGAVDNNPVPPAPDPDPGKNGDGDDESADDSDQEEEEIEPEVVPDHLLDFQMPLDEYIAVDGVDEGTWTATYNTKVFKMNQTEVTLYQLIPGGKVRKYIPLENEQTATGEVMSYIPVMNGSTGYTRSVSTGGLYTQEWEDRNTAIANALIKYEVMVFEASEIKFLKSFRTLFERIEQFLTAEPGRHIGYCRHNKRREIPYFVPFYLFMTAKNSPLITSNLTQNYIFCELKRFLNVAHGNVPHDILVGTFLKIIKTNLQVSMDAHGVTNSINEIGVINLFDKASSRNETLSTVMISKDESQISPENFFTPFTDTTICNKMALYRYNSDESHFIDQWGRVKPEFHHLTITSVRFDCIKVKGSLIKYDPLKSMISFNTYNKSVTNKPPRLAISLNFLTFGNRANVQNHLEPTVQSAAMLRLLQPRDNEEELHNDQLKTGLDIIYTMAKLLDHEVLQNTDYKSNDLWDEFEEYAAHNEKNLPQFTGVVHGSVPFIRKHFTPMSYWASDIHKAAWVDIHPGIVANAIINLCQKRSVEFNSVEQLLIMLEADLYTATKEAIEYVGGPKMEGRLKRLEELRNNPQALHAMQKFAVAQIKPHEFQKIKFKNGKEYLQYARIVANLTDDKYFYQCPAAHRIHKITLSTIYTFNLLYNNPAEPTIEVKCLNYTTSESHNKYFVFKDPDDAINLYDYTPFIAASPLSGGTARYFGVYYTYIMKEHNRQKDLHVVGKQPQWIITYSDDSITHNGDKTDEKDITKNDLSHALITFCVCYISNNARIAKKLLTSYECASWPIRVSALEDINDYVLLCAVYLAFLFSGGMLTTGSNNKQNMTSLILSVQGMGSEKYGFEMTSNLLDSHKAAFLSHIYAKPEYPVKAIELNEQYKKECEISKKVIDEKELYNEDEEDIYVAYKLPATIFRKFGRRDHSLPPTTTPEEEFFNDIRGAMVHSGALYIRCLYIGFVINILIHAAVIKKNVLRRKFRIKKHWLKATAMRASLNLSSFTLNNEDIALLKAHMDPNTTLNDIVEVYLDFCSKLITDLRPTGFINHRMIDIFNKKRYDMSGSCWDDTVFSSDEYVDPDLDLFSQRA